MTTTTMTPQYRVQIRDHNLVPLGELPDFIDGDILLKFNDVGSWVLTVRADSPMAADFAAGNGVIISRDRGDGSGAQTIISGPIWHLERQLQNNVYVLSGPSDEFWLKARDCWPVIAAPDYGSSVLALPGILRYYKLGEASGTSATDSKSGVSGTYNGGVTLAQRSIVDDAALNPLFDGSSGYVSAAGTSLPTGNSPMWLGCWIYLTALPAAAATPFWYGNPTEGTRTGLYAQISTSGQLLAKTDSSTGTGGASGVTLNAPHLIGVMWDGTNLTAWLDGAQVKTTAPGALNMTSTALHIGQKISSSFMPGYLGHMMAGSGTLTAAQWQSAYLNGLTRFAAAAYDTRTDVASTVIRGYVNDNAGPGAVTARQVFGLTLAADPALGSVITGNERFDNLLTACQQLAVSGGDLGFRVTQTDVGVLTFSLYQPATVSNAIFSRELGNLLDATYTLDGPVANQYVGGGGGEGALRVFVQGQDSASITTWGRVEGFLDARDTSDTATITQRIAAQLSQDAVQTNLTITPVDTAALQFGRDYGLGDVVSVQIDGTTITDVIRQLHITLNSTDQELVTPGIGNAGAGQIVQVFDAKQRALAAVARKLARLQTAQ